MLCFNAVLSISNKDDVGQISAPITLLQCHQEKSASDEELLIQKKMFCYVALI